MPTYGCIIVSIRSSIGIGLIVDFSDIMFVTRYESMALGLTGRRADHETPGNFHDVYATGLLPRWDSQPKALECKGTNWIHFVFGVESKP